MMNTRVLQVAAIDEQIDLCRGELSKLRFIGGIYWWDKKKYTKVDLLPCLMRKIKLARFKNNDTVLFDNLGYYPELREIKRVIKRIIIDEFGSETT